MYTRHVVVSSLAAAFVLFASALSLHAAGLTAADYGRSVDFKPLVRHMISQLHCYDAGTDECERTSHLGTSFSKEHTLGFLLDGSSRTMRDRGFKPLYVCAARDNSHTMMVTGGLAENDPKGECRAAGFRAEQVGYISSTANIEAPWALYRCRDTTTHDTLLTHSPSECSSAGYSQTELLGYLYAGGPETLK